MDVQAVVNLAGHATDAAINPTGAAAITAIIVAVCQIVRSDDVTSGPKQTNASPIITIRITPATKNAACELPSLIG
jgi:hypothetical protein